MKHPAFMSCLVVAASVHMVHADDAGTGQAPAHVNSLIHETSPYLLQHAYNPVDWSPWGTEAIERARLEDKPIFLSIGYSTCYWCHVMERESFEDEETGAILNRDFIPIKVDREERPDVDEIYMAGVQVLTGRGGWPMSMFLDPHTLQPFGGGTYFPPEARYNKPGFKDLLGQVSSDWKDNRAELDQRAYETGQEIRARLSVFRQPQAISRDSVTRAGASILGNYDRVHGGFRRSAPKFPIPVQLDFLLKTRWDDTDTRNALIYTLDRMAQGGIHDQVGGGFHRYSTDAKWLVPHFEKMLYDNGQLASVYAQAYELTDDPWYAHVVRGTLDYVLREMTSPEGGFYSAQDAEVDHREGLNYLWMPEEVRTTLITAGLPTEVEIAFVAYGLDKPANFRDPHHRDEPAQHILHLQQRPDKIAESLGMEPAEFQERLDAINMALLAARDKRKQPALDDKVLSGWNGLMILGMADGGRVLEDEKYILAANRAADFVMERMRNEDGMLQRSWREGVAKTNAFLEDYAFMIRGLLALHEATGDPVRLEQAEALAAEVRASFWNEQFGGYYDTMPDQEDLFVRARTLRDSVIPSGNSMMIGNLADLADRTGEPGYEEDLVMTTRSLSPWLARSPTTPIHATGVLQRLDDAQLAKVSAGAMVLEEQRNMTLTSTPKALLLEAGQTGRIEIVFTISKGYHMNAPEPVQKDLMGLQVSGIGDAVTVVPHYPDPVEWKGPLGTMLVYEGSITVPVDVTWTGKSNGPARIMTRFQLCNDEVCLQPRVELIPTRISPGR